MDSLSRYFREEMGVSIVAFLNRYRLVQACKLLENTHQSITEIAGEVGFESHSYFTRTFLRDIGVTPTEYRQGQRRAGH
jgi:AraC-like DNA-binding protein